MTHDHAAMLIRPADPSRDAQACAAIYAPWVRDTCVSFETAVPTVTDMAGRIERYSGSHAWLVAEIDGAVVGYAYASPHRERAAYASSCDVAIYVDARFGRQGVGRALYGRLLDTLRAKGLHAAYAGIALPNAGSIALHEVMGFVPVGIYREVGWKLGAWRDVGWWQRLL